MARKLRLEYPGAIYHVMNRGDRREAIFTDDEDRQRFLDCLGEACAKTQWQVHAFCPRACLETTRGAAARDFGCGQGGLGGAQRHAAGCKERANAGHGQKTRRPEGFRGKGRLASLLLSRRSTRDILLRRVSPSGLFPENSAPRSFRTGSKGKCGAEIRRRKAERRNPENQEWGLWNSPLRVKRQSRARVALYTRESCEMHEMVKRRNRLAASVNQPTSAQTKAKLR